MFWRQGATLRQSEIQRNTSVWEVRFQVLRYLKNIKIRKYIKVVKYKINSVIDIIFIISLTSSRPKPIVCLHYVLCMHTTLESIPCDLRATVCTDTCHWDAIPWITQNGLRCQQTLDFGQELIR
jgi:hypothetical protein